MQLYCLRIIFFSFLFFKTFSLDAQQISELKESSIEQLLQQAVAPADSDRLSAMLELTTRYLGNEQDSARLFAQGALRIAKSLQDEENTARAHEFLGRIYKSQSQVDSAFFHLDAALAVSNSSAMQSGVYLQKSGLYQLSGQYEFALKALLAMDSIGKATNNADTQGKAMASIGELWRVRDRPEEALTYLAAAAEIFKEIGNTNNYLWTLGRMGTCYRGTGRYAEGIRLIKEILREENHPFLSKNNLALNHNALGHLYADDGQLDLAEQQFKTSIAFAKEVGRNYFVQNGLNRLIDIYTQQGQFTKAIRAGKEALTLCEGGKDFRNLKNVHYNLSLAYEQTDSINQSLYHLKQHTIYKDSLVNTERLEVTEELEEKYKTTLQKQEILAREKDLETANTQRNGAILIGLLTAALLFLFFRQRNLKKQKEAEILAARTEELERLDNLKSRFFANISHELRTPLTLIWGPLNALMKKNAGELTPSVEQNLGIIKNNSHRLLELVEEILDLSKLDADKMDVRISEISLKSFILRLTYAFQSATQMKNIDFKINNLLSDTLVIKTDKKKLEKIFNNLISNALKFTPEGGEIIFIADTKENGNLQFKVKDSGRGIHPEDLPHIFNRFYQSSRKDVPLEGGTGIGLALSKEFTTLLGGKLTAKSDFGKGSLFTFELPKELIAEKTGSESVDTPSLTIARKTAKTDKDITLSLVPEIVSKSEDDSRPTLLVVEDNPEMQTFLSAILSADYQVLVAGNGKLALENLADSSPAVDMVISDVMMPEMDGFELLNTLKSEEEFLHLPVIMLTARADMRDKLQALNKGVDDYMTKPFDEEELKIRVKNLLENRQQRQAAKTSKSNAESPKIRKADLAWLKNVEQILKRELANSNYTLLSLAAEIAVSKSQLHRKIKLLTGLTPNKYYREIKLNYAKELLEDRTHLTVAEVSYAVGFEDPQYFSKIYAERFGKKPSAYF